MAEVPESCYAPELVGKGFERIGYSLVCPNCCSSNTSAVMPRLVYDAAGEASEADWCCFACGLQFHHEDSLSFWIGLGP